ncbi:sensor histidine kinase [Spirochaeta isovalerica]|uniref:histidine kinase n=1 Tax=Spirochaeta isovalerica TaxID=150 RepID=A0A841R9I3_9SPIO|nr:ATP-binding protein [Spirochaeta isovalerica]MBB6479670.1 nitrogen fixation/metabolism regulation signal transduction histidine kinase [Spirochaeta isovalerica]
MVYRVVFIIANTLLAVFLFSRGHLLLTPYFVSLLIPLQVFLLYRKEQREKDRIVAHIESVVLDENQGSRLTHGNRLYSKIDNLLYDLEEKYRESLREIEEKDSLLDVIQNHVNVGLLSFDREGQIDLLNKPARLLLSVGYVSHLWECFPGDSELIDDLLNFKTPFCRTLELKDKGPVLMESSDFILNGQPLRILSIQNIRRALDDKELDSWNVLIRSLNHEIMNSITPISSLAASVLTLVENDPRSDLVEAIEIIARRSSNLMKFIDNYKSLSQIPSPRMELIGVHSLLSRIAILMSVPENLFDLKVNCEEGEGEIFINGDLSQVEQMLINLVKNSMEASASTVVLSCGTRSDGAVVLSVSDNGSGFTDESLERALLPFYTTKPEGSGIGLSLIRQIMRLHGGDISIKNEETGSCIELIFP